MVAEGDKLVVRWAIQGTHTGEFLGIAPTNKEVTLPTTEMFRIRSGQLVEAWDSYDRLSFMQQLGAIRSLTQAMDAHGARQQQVVRQG